jgi:hypothetical protein
LWQSFFYGDLLGLIGYPRWKTTLVISSPLLTQYICRYLAHQESVSIVLSLWMYCAMVTGTHLTWTAFILVRNHSIYYGIKHVIGVFVCCVMQEENKLIAECRVRYLSFLGIGRNVKQCGFIMHTAQDLFIAHVFHCEPSSGALCKTVEAACKVSILKTDWLINRSFLSSQSLFFCSKNFLVISRLYRQVQHNFCFPALCY